MRGGVPRYGGSGGADGDGDGDGGVLEWKVEVQWKPKSMWTKTSMLVVGFV